MILLISASGTGSGRRRRMARVVLMISKRSQTWVTGASLFARKYGIDLVHVRPEGQHLRLDQAFQLSPAPVKRRCALQVVASNRGPRRSRLSAAEGPSGRPLRRNATAASAAQSFSPSPLAIA